ncbi:MAG: MFS transporter [Firmicutes bacterium]|nr:MFS transporter [Bacillota bacterium]
MNANYSKTRIKIGIYAMAVLMMGIVGVSGSLTVIGAHFPNASQSMIQSIISIPCLAVLPTTILSGKLMEVMPKKTLGIIGMLIFLAGGVVPVVMTSLPLILLLRALFGIGVGVVQAVASALVAENFFGPERESVQGTMTSAQMLGCAVMVFAGGWLGDLAWNASFLVHGIAILSLIVAFVCLPLVRTPKQGKRGEEDFAEESDRAGRQKTYLNKSSWSWAGITFALFIGVQVYTVYISYVLSEKAIGGAAESGATVAVACVGGFIMGVLYGKLAGRAGDLTFAIGLFIMALSYLILAFAGSMFVIYIGGFVYGIAMAICMPAAFVNTANSVDAFSSAMALSITMCAQNLGQFVCPYIMNFITGAMGSTNPSTMTYLLAALLLAGMSVPAVIWGVRKSHKEQKGN